MRHISHGPGLVVPEFDRSLEADVGESGAFADIFDGAISVTRVMKHSGPFFLDI